MRRSPALYQNLESLRQLSARTQLRNCQHRAVRVEAITLALLRLLPVSRVDGVVPPNRLRNLTSPKPM